MRSDHRSEKLTHIKGQRRNNDPKNSNLSPRYNPNRKLSIEELKSLNLPLIFQGDTVTIERSINGWKLRHRSA